MSHPLYNPYASGSKGSSQDQYKPPGRSEREHWRAQHQSGPDLGFSPSEASSSAPNNLERTVLQYQETPAGYRPEQRMVRSERDVEPSVSSYLARAREEVRHQPLSHGFTQRDERFPSSVEAPSYPDVDRRQVSDVQSSSSSLNWLQICKKPTESSPSTSYSSASSDFHSGGATFFTPTDGQHDRRSVQGLGSFDSPMPEQQAQRSQPRGSQYTVDIATNILEQFGLEKNDLELLLSYPEDQLNSDNLPYVLKQIRLQKQKQAETTQPYLDPQPTTSFSGMDRLSGSRETGVCKDTIKPSNPIKISKVIEYGHTAKYNVAGTPAEKKSRDSRRDQSQNTSETKSSATLSSLDQLGNAPIFGPTRTSVAPPTSSPTDPTQTQQSKASKRTFSLFPILPKETDSKVHNVEPTKPVTSQKPGQDPPKPSASQSLQEKPIKIVLDVNRNVQGRSQNQPQEPKSQQNKATDSKKQQPVPLLPGLGGGRSSDTRTDVSRPSEDKMRDCAGTVPTQYPHVCSLCNMIANNMKVRGQNQSLCSLFNIFTYNFNHLHCFWYFGFSVF